MAMNSTNIVVEDPADLVLLLLYTSGKSNEYSEPIEGITRLQKLVFLLQKDVGLGRLIKEAKQILYEPYKMGPYSKQLQQDLGDLISAGLISTKRLHYYITDDADQSNIGEIGIDAHSDSDRKIESLQFKLTDFGNEVARDLWKSLNKFQKEELTKFKSFFNSLSLRQLLIYVYDKFPPYTTRSEIKKSLGSKYW